MVDQDLTESGFGAPGMMEPMMPPPPPEPMMPAPEPMAPAAPARKPAKKKAKKAAPRKRPAKKKASPKKKAAKKAFWLPMRIYIGLFKPTRIKILGQEVAGKIEGVGKDVIKSKLEIPCMRGLRCA